jgi:hypothetical protein
MVYRGASVELRQCACASTIAVVLEDARPDVHPCYPHGSLEASRSVAGD